MNSTVTPVDCELLTTSGAQRRLRAARPQLSWFGGLDFVRVNPAPLAGLGPQVLSSPGPGLWAVVIYRCPWSVWAAAQCITALAT